MEFRELINKRYSCRKFKKKEVPFNLIMEIVEAGRTAPTAVNKQPYKIFYLHGKEAMEKLKEATPFTFHCEDFLVVGTKSQEAWVREFDNKNFADVDGSIVATTMMFKIEDLGLNTTWVGHFDQNKVKEAFSKDKTEKGDIFNYELIAIFPIGYEREDAPKSKLHFERKNLEEVFQEL